MQQQAMLSHEIKKIQVKEIVLFAINNIPEADSNTLKQFLELINAGGTFGSISHAQIIKKMHMVLRYIPQACVHSLLILTDLLEIELPSQQLLGSPQTKWLNSNEERGNSAPFFLDMSAAMTNQVKKQGSSYK